MDGSLVDLQKKKKADIMLIKCFYYELEQMSDTYFQKYFLIFFFLIK